MTEKLPIGEELERDLFVSFVQDKKIFASFHEDIESHYFTDKNNEKLFKVFNFYFKKYKHIPTLNQTKSLIAKAQKSISNKEELSEYVDGIFKNPILTTHEIQYLEDSLRTFIKRSKVKTAILESIDLLEDPKQFMKIDSLIRNAILWKDNVSLGTNMTNVVERYERTKEMFEHVVGTPWPSLNKYLSGGFMNKTLTCIFAGSSIGKSIALDNAAQYAYEHGFNVLEITLEMSEEIKGLRIDSSLTNKDLKSLVENNEDSIKIWNSHKDKKNKFFIKEYPSSTISAQHIENYLYKLEVYEDFKPDILFVDYAGLMLPTGANKNSLYEAGGAVMEDLRALAINYNIPVVTADQLKREAINMPIDELDESFIADSDRKRRNIDNGIIIASVPEERAAGVSGWKIIKNRNGDKDKVFRVNIDYQHFKFYQKSLK